MKKIVTVLALAALMGCGSSSQHNSGYFIAEGNLTLSIDGTPGFSLALVDVNMGFTDTPTPVGTEVPLYINGAKHCTFNVYWQRGEKNQYIVTLENPLYQEAACQSLEKSFLLQMSADRVGTLTSL